MTAAIVILALLCALLIVTLAATLVRFSGDVGYRRAYGRLADELRATEDRERRLAAEVTELRHELDAEGMRESVGRRLVVQTKDNQSIEGVLERVNSDSYRLTSAKYLAGSARATQVGGEVLVLKSNFSWAQVLAESDAGAAA